MRQPVNDSVHVLGIGGSTRAGSKSLVALRAALSQVEAAGATTELADLHTLELPLYNSDRTWADQPAAVHWLIAAARRADALIVCSPTYHGTLTGAVKNALDLIDFMGDGADGLPGANLKDKVVGLMATGGGGGNVLTALYHSTRALEAIVAPTVVTIGNGVIDLGNDELSDPNVVARLRTMAREVVDLTKRLRPLPAKD
jgi:FMN reductase